MKNKLLLAAAVFFAFFFIGLATLSDYGINWDTPIHYLRGQAYLHYFLTSKTDYGDFETKPPARRSYFQTTFRPASYFLEHDTGHPPLNGILAAFFNLIFYQKLGILGDIESYHLFVLFLSSVLIFIVFKFASENYGVFAGLISALSLSLSPLFLAESHFNIKDPVEAAFYGLTIYGFYQGVKHKSWRWFLASSVFCGFALGTKFNIFFIPFIILPWLIARYFKEILKFKQRIIVKILNLPRKILLSLFFYPFIVFGIFFLSWPYLWQDPIVNFWSIFNYYKQIGSGPVIQLPSFYFLGFGLYPIQTVLFTTPLVVLFFFFLGIVASFFLFKREKNKTSFLFLLWFLVPIIRVSLPGASIYGGVRQIMEYIPAMALLSGLGAEMLRKKAEAWLVKLRFKQKFIIHYSLFIILLLFFLPITLKMIEIHPNQNVYFNPLIGGLKGAKERDYPYWGLTLGSVYKQGVEWLNENAEKGAKVALVIGTGANIPRIYLREDLRFDNQFWSGYKKEGEYLIEAVYQDWIKDYWFCGEYVDRILEPVWELKVEGVPILKIWKNDKEHTYRKYLEEKWFVVPFLKWRKEKNSLFMTLPEPIEIMHVVIGFRENNCSLLDSGKFYFSQDGEKWSVSPEPIREYMIEENKLIYPVAVRSARLVRFSVESKRPCLFEVSSIKISGVSK